MKIAMLAHSLHPIAEPYAGGLEMITHILCKELKESGHEIHLYAHLESDPTLDLHPLSRSKYSRMRKEEGNTSWNGAEYLDQISIYSQTISKIERGKYDLVHNQSLSDTAMVLCNFISTPAVTTLHTPIFPNLELGAVLIGSLVKHKIIAVSHSLAHTWSPLFASIGVIYNGIDISKWDYSDAASSHTAFWMGRICPEKAPHHAIKACLEAKVRLRLAGPISNEVYYNQEVLPLLGNRDIQYIGHVNQRVLNRELGSAMCLLFTSIWDEPYGLVLAEALACGTPVLAYNSGAASEIITADSGTLVRMGNWRDMAKLLHQKIRKDRRKCRSRAIEFCSAQRMVDNYEALYASCIGTKITQKLA